MAGRKAASKAAEKPAASKAAAKTAASKKLSNPEPNVKDEVDEASDPPFSPAASSSKPRFGSGSGTKISMVTATPINPAVLEFNAVQLEYVKECLSVITANSKFNDIITANPLNMNEGAREAPFDSEGYLSSMTQTGMAKAGCNFFWQAWSGNSS